MKAFGFEVTREEIQSTIRVFKEIFARVKIPKSPKGKVGISVAIKVENEAERVRLDTDFIDELDNALRNTKDAAPYHIIRFSPQLASKINSEDDARTLLHRSKSRMLIWGSLSSRNHKGEECFVFRINAIVRHAPIDKKMKSVLGKEMADLLPRKVLFTTSEEVFGFEITQQWLSYAIRYFVGIAIHISVSPDLAIGLFTSLQSDIGKIGSVIDTVPPMLEIKYRLPKRIEETQQSRLSVRYNLFMKTRDIKWILSTGSILDDMETRGFSSYKQTLSRAMYLFFKNEISKAIKVLQNCKEPDGTWRLSLGFLLAYHGDIDGALEQYRKVAYVPIIDTAAADSEIFIQEILAERPDLPQLRFFSGIINLKIKHDYRLALSDFQEFLDNKNVLKEYPKLVELAKKYKFELETQMGI